MIIVSEPQQWRVTLHDGQTVGVWAGMVGEEGDHYTFEVLIDATPEEQADEELVITGTTPAKPERVLIAVARFPKASVKKVETEAWESVPVQ